MSDEIKKEFGKHYLVEFIDCNENKLKRVEDLKEAFLESAQLSKATIIDSFFHQFDPQGVSAIIFIAESHFSIHTWPEDRYVAFDILTCGSMFPEKAIEYLSGFFESSEVKTKIISRGF